MSRPVVAALSASKEHQFSKHPCEHITLVEGLGVAGDAHSGRTVQHLSRVKVDPDQPNLRQVHLLHAELLESLSAQGFALLAGDLGENILTRGLDLLSLPENALLEIGDARIRITGLRNPCKQIEAFKPGLLAHMIEKRPDGSLHRKCGIMGVVEQGGTVTRGQPIVVILPDGAHQPLKPV